MYFFNITIIYSKNTWFVQLTYEAPGKIQMSNRQLPKYTLQNTNVQHNFKSLNTLTNCIFLFMFYLTCIF